MNTYSEKSVNPADVPEKIKVNIGNLGPALAEAARQNGRTLSEEIRRRLEDSLKYSAPSAKNQIK